jgi:hypothetical protein
MQLPSREILFPSDKHWVAEVHLEGQGSFLVCRDFNDLREALDTCFANDGHMNNREAGKTTFDEYEADYGLDTITIKFREMSQQELDEIGEFEGF